MNPSPLAGGTVTGNGAYADESEVTVIATPNPGYLFKRWERGNSNASSQKTYTFVLDRDTTLNARFATAYETSTSSLPATAGGTSGGGQFEDGDNVVVIASPNAGYVFTRWTEDGEVVSSSANYSFKANPARTLIANFDLVIPEIATTTIADGGFMLRWPTGLPGWVLEESSDLAPGHWVASERAMEAAGGECQVHVVPEPGARFFRLRHP